MKRSAKIIALNIAAISFIFSIQADSGESRSTASKAITPHLKVNPKQVSTSPAGKIQPSEPAASSLKINAPTNTSFSVGDNNINRSLGCVDVYKVFQESEQAREDEQKILSEFESRKKVVEEAYIKHRKLQEEIQSMGATVKASVREAKIEEMRELQKTIEVKAQGLEEYRNRAAQEAQMKILKEVEETAEEIRKERGLLVVFAGGTLAVDPSIDVSSAVAERMNKKHASKKERQAPTRIS